MVSLDDELAYWIARPAWGKGYGFEAAHGATGYWFKTNPQTPLKSGYFDGNDRSGRTLTALGFRLSERITRYARSFQQDVISNQMILTPEDWRQRQDFTVYTPRLTLRPLRETDADAFAALTTPEVTRMLSRVKPNMTRDDVLAEMPRRRWRGTLGFTLAIELGGQMIGTVGIGGLPPATGYFLAPDYWGKGFMTEALSAFLPEIFKRFPLSRIIADHFEDNPASGAILRKLGFTETGTDMGHSMARLEPAPLITYALVRENLRVPV